MLIRDALDLFYEICTDNIKDYVNKELENNENRFQKILNSEELVELLYVAYNRDAAESFTLRDAINSDYTRLYSTARDVLEEKKKRIEAQVEQAAAQLASQSLVKADNDIRTERANRVRQVKEKAKEMVDEYKDDISKPLYERTQKAIDDSDAEAILKETEELTESQGNN